MSGSIGSTRFLAKDMRMLQGASFAAQNSYGISPNLREQDLEWRRRFLIRVGVNKNGRIVKLSTVSDYSPATEATYKTVTQEVVNSLELK